MRGDKGKPPTLAWQVRTSTSGASTLHWAGDAKAGVEPFRWAGGQWTWGYLDARERAYPNLVAHDRAYPAPDLLRPVTCIGNVRTEGDTDADGPELIRSRILADDPRPPYLLAGGGTDTGARALRRIEQDWRNTPEWGRVFRQVCEKAIIFMIVTQDDTCRDYIAGAWPEMRTLHRTSISGTALMFDEAVVPAGCLHVHGGGWLKPHPLDKGPLPALCHTWSDGHVYPGEREQSQFGSNLGLAAGTWWGHQVRERHDMISEGDSPSFLYLIDKGLRSTEDPGFGDWGGRFRRVRDNEFNPEADYWATAPDACEPPMRGEAYQLTRWTRDWMMDFASRASWCVTPRYEDANHAPEVTVAEGLDLVASAGERLVLHAMASDPGGDEVSCGWFRYADADGYAGAVVLEADGSVCTVLMPDDARPGPRRHRPRDLPCHGRGRRARRIHGGLCPRHHYRGRRRGPAH